MTTLNTFGISSEVADELVSTLEQTLSRFNLEFTGDPLDLQLDLIEILYNTPCEEVA